MTHVFEINEKKMYIKNNNDIWKINLKFAVFNLASSTFSVVAAKNNI